MTKQAPDGEYIFGLFLEGCRFDDRKELLDESNPKVLFTEMKPIWVLPKHKQDIFRDHDTTCLDYLGHSYRCPVYKMAARKGTLSTTGHNSNFVCYIYVPMQKKHTEKHWVKRGVAMLTSLSD